MSSSLLRRSCVALVGSVGRPVIGVSDASLATLGSIRHKSKLFSPAPRIVVRKRALVPTTTPHTSLVSVTIKPALECWVDAATRTGLIAIVVGKQYKVFRLKEGWQEPGRNIHWAETVAFELLTRVLVAQGYTGLVNVRSDSEIALRVFGGGKCRVKSVQECGERLQYIRHLLPFTMVCSKVGGKQNLADGFSRGRTAEGYQKFKRQVVIPEALEPFVYAD